LCVGCVAVNSAMLTPRMFISRTISVSRSDRFTVFRKPFWFSREKVTQKQANDDRKSWNGICRSFQQGSRAIQQRIQQSLTRKDLGVLPSVSSYVPSGDPGIARWDSALPIQNPTCVISYESKRERESTGLNDIDVEKGDRRPATIG
jgi:hypothetical protein